VPQQQKQGWSQPRSTNQGKYQGNNYYNSSNFKQPSLRNLISEQARINNNIAKRLSCNDKILESISAKMNSFSSAVKEQMIFNKKVELQLAQLASTLPVATNLEKVKAISTRGGKSTRDPPYPKGAGKTPVAVQAEAEKEDNELLPQEHELQQDFRDTTLLLFLCRNRKAKMD
jgi:hypothetical protein